MCIKNGDRLGRPVFQRERSWIEPSSSTAGPVHASDRRQSTGPAVRPEACQSVRDGLTRATHPAPAPRHVGAALSTSGRVY
jgi:hypothetical protein